MHHPILPALSLALALPLLALTGGCELVQLFNPPSPPEPALAEVQPAPPSKPLVADRVVVRKEARILELLHDGKVFKTYPIALGAHSKGPKREAGDGRTPEGAYRIDGRSERTRYTRELHISYPNREDRARSQAMNVAPGGGIYIHGLPRDFGPYDPPKWEKDWTDGCISVGNAAIVAIWNDVPDGTPIDILP
jgi:murein L,D-transpeptidase YafK